MKTTPSLFIALLAALILLNGSRVIAANESPQSFTYQGQLTNSQGTAPLLDTVVIDVAIYDPAGTCLLYKETQPPIDLSASAGLFAIQVGSSVGPGKRVVGTDPGLSMANIFANKGTQLRAPGSPGCAAGYTPLAGDNRLLRFTVTPQSGPSETLSPDQILSAVPQALVAETLQGLTPTDFLRVKASESLTQTNLELLTKGSDASSPTMLHHHDSQYVKLGTGGSISVASGATIGLGHSTPNTTGWGATEGGRTWFDAGTSEIKFWDGSQVKSLGVAGAGLQSLNGLTTSTQSFAIGTTGTAPAFSSATSTHTLNIPMASGASVTAGLISNADYTAFSGKQNALGYTPLNPAGGTMTGALTLATGTTTLAPLNIPSGTLKTTPASGDVEFNGTNLFITTSARQKICSYDSSLTPNTGETLKWTGTAWAPGTLPTAALADQSVTAAKLGTDVGLWAVSGSDVYRSSGNIGLGTSTPATRLDVNGAVRLGNDATACAAGLAGALRYNAGTGVIELCHSNSWGAIASAATYVSTSSTQTITGDKTFSGTNTYSGASSFSGQATFSAAGPSAALVVGGGGLQVTSGGLNNSGLGITNSGNITGSSASGANLSIESTSHGTKGNILLAPNGGKVGVGTLNPGTALHVSGSDATGVGITATVENTATTGSPFSGFAMKTSGVDTGYLFGSTTVNDSYGVANGITIGPGTAAQDIGFRVGSTITGGGTGPSVIIKSTGNVGIGNKNPAARLDIADTGGPALFHSQITGSTGQNAFYFENDRGSYASYGGMLYGASNSANSNLFGADRKDKFVIFADGASNLGLYAGTLGAQPFVMGTNNSERVRIDATGNVGIGTASPSTKLNVAGPIVSTPYNIASGATVDLSTSNTITLASVGGSAITLQNMVHGGLYSLVIQDTTSRTYTFSGCNTSKFRPANMATTAGTGTIYTILTVYNGASYDCWITWASGYQ